MVQLRRFLLFLTLAFSFGGFTFYAAVVVPIGGHVLGKATQGFVTRQVTHAINAATLLSVAVLVWEAVAGRRERTRSANAVLWASIAAVAICCLALVVLHLRVDSFLSVEGMTVNDYDTFYLAHRVYLWTSAVQWLATLPIIWILVKGWPADAAKIAR